MSLFQPLTLNWEGRDYVIPPDRVMGAIATVEDVITLGELANVSQSGNINISKLARAYSALITYAGAMNASWEVVYKSMFQGNQQVALLAVRSLLIMMMPPGTIQLGEVKPQGKAKAGSRSSKRPTKRPSA